MRCEEARLLISVGLDDELSDRPAAGLQEHLAECATCRRERAALACTVQLLRAVPEADPPAELRRRIGVALLEEERRAARRRFGWAWLARPRTAGWAWGAAAGAAVATVALVTTQGGHRTRRVAVAPLAVAVPSVTPARQSPPAVNESVGHKPAASKPRTASAPAPMADEPRVIAVSPPSQAPSIEAPPPLTVQGPPVSHRAPAAQGRLAGRQRPATRTSPPAASAPLLAHATGARDDRTTPRPASADRDSPRLAWMNQPSSTGSPASDPMDVDEGLDTSTMTDMASMPMPAPAAEPPDDLSDLRRRLTDRPLQAPELGPQKPAGAGAARRDGWIRF